MAYSDVKLHEAQATLQQYQLGQPQFMNYLGIYRDEWEPFTSYEVNDMVRVADGDYIWLCTTSHQSTGTFDATKWASLLSIAPFQEVASQTLGYITDLQGVIAQGQTVKDSLDAAIAELQALTADVLAGLLEEAIEELGNEFQRRPLVLTVEDVTPENAASWVIAVDREGLTGARQVGLLDALEALGIGNSVGEDVADDGLSYFRTFEAWIEAKLSNLTDVSAGTPQDGQAIVWSSGLSRYIPYSIPAAVVSLADLADVESGLNPNDLDVLVWNSDEDQFEAQPFPSVAATTEIPVAGTLTGPTTHTFTASDKGKLWFIDLGAGHVDVLFDDTVSTTANTVIPSYYRVTQLATGDITYYLRFRAAAGAGATAPVYGATAKASQASGVTSTAIATVDTSQFNLAHPGGTDAGIVVILHAATTSPTTTTLQSPQCEIAGVNYDWNMSSPAPSGSTPKGFARAHALGTIGPGNISVQGKFAVQPAQTHSGLCSYALMAFGVTGMNQDVPYDSDKSVIGRTDSGVASKDATLNLTTEGQLIIYSACKRGNSGDTAMSMTGSGVTQVQEFNAQGGGTPSQSTGNSRHMAGWKNGVVGANIATLNFGPVAPFTEVHMVLNNSDAGAIAVNINPPGDDTVANLAKKKTAGVLYTKNTTPTQVYVDY